MAQLLVNIPESKLSMFLDFFSNHGAKVINEDNDTEDVEFSKELSKALDEAIESVKNHGTKSHEQVMSEMRKEFPTAFRK